MKNSDTDITTNGKKVLPDFENHVFSQTVRKSLSELFNLNTISKQTEKNKEKINIDSNENINTIDKIKEDNYTNLNNSNKNINNETNSNLNSTNYNINNKTFTPSSNKLNNSLNVNNLFNNSKREFHSTSFKSYTTLYSKIRSTQLSVPYFSNLHSSSSKLNNVAFITSNLIRLKLKTHNRDFHSSPFLLINEQENKDFNSSTFNNTNLATEILKKNKNNIVNTFLYNYLSNPLYTKCNEILENKTLSNFHKQKKLEKSLTDFWKKEINSIYNQKDKLFKSKYGLSLLYTNLISLEKDIKELKINSNKYLKGKSYKKLLLSISSLDIISIVLSNVIPFCVKYDTFLKQNITSLYQKIGKEIYKVYYNTE